MRFVGTAALGALALLCAAPAVRASVTIEIPDDLCSDDTEGDSVPTVTQGKIGVGKPGVDTDVSEAVFRFAESACPGISYFQRRIRKQAPELFHEGSCLLRNQRVPALRIDEVYVFAADDDTPFGGGPQIEVRCAAFPNEALLIPSRNLRERLTDERVGALQDTSLGVQEGF
jgi:hypothetical protein